MRRHGSSFVTRGLKPRPFSAAGEGKRSPICIRRNIVCIVLGFLQTVEHTTKYMVKKMGCQIFAAC